jgi:hypothetical protein
MRRKRVDLGTLNDRYTFQQWFTFCETYPHGIPGFYSVSAVVALKWNNELTVCRELLSTLTNPTLR